MNLDRLYKIILGPHVTEKSSMATGSNAQVAFKVSKDAKKLEIKKAVEILFETKVNSVRVINMKGKTKRTKIGVGKKSDWKKAYITLADGEEIDLQKLGQEAQNMGERMQQLRDEKQILEMRQKENLVLMNTYAASLKQMANPDPKIEIVKK